jgi:hypothetical protein
MIWLIAFAILAAPPQQDDNLRQKIKGLWSCDEDTGLRQRELAKIAQSAIDELPAMIQESQGDERQSLVHLYGEIAGWKPLPRTPAVIINLARAGDVVAARVALQILDDRAITFLLEGLERIAKDETTENGFLEDALLDRAGWTHNQDVGKALHSMLKTLRGRRQVQVIDALGILGYAPALDDLRTLIGEPNAMTSGRSRHAVEKIDLLSSKDRAGRLMAKACGMHMAGEFSWYRWSLDWILHLRLAEAAPALRARYDEFVEKFGPAGVAGEWSATLLHAIHDLGGKLSEEETALLHSLGRLPAAEKPKEEALAVKRGFEAGVWGSIAERTKQREARNAPPPRIPEDKLPRILKDRIRFVLDLNPPDPSYLAPHPTVALETLEEMLKTAGEPADVSKLLDAYRYLAGLREGMKTPDVILDLARRGRWDAMRCATTIADDRAEECFLDELKAPRGDHMAAQVGRLSSPAVIQALVRFYRADPGRRIRLIPVLADLGAVELLPELRTVKTHFPEIRMAIERLEILGAPDRDAKLLATTKSMRMSGEFSWYQWGLDQIVRLDLKPLAPELRTWFDGMKVKWKWVPSHDPYNFVNRVPWALKKLGAPVTPEEEELIKKSGRGP